MRLNIVILDRPEFVSLFTIQNKQLVFEISNSMFRHFHHTDKMSWIHKINGIQCMNALDALVCVVEVLMMHMFGWWCALLPILFCLSRQSHLVDKHLNSVFELAYCYSSCRD